MSEATGTPEKPASRAEDFLDVYIAPAELFRRRVDGKFGLALLVLIVAWAALFFATRNAIQPIFDAEFTRGLSANPNLTPEQIEAGRRVMRNFAPVTMIVSVPIMAFLLGLAVWLGGRAAGAKLRYLQTVTIATFALFPRLIEMVVNGIQALLLDESSLTSRFAVNVGVARLLDPATTSPPLLALLGRLDVFTLWITILIAVGLRQMGRVTTGQAATGAAIVWLLGALPTVGGALFQR